MSIEAARKAVQGEVLSTDEIEKIIAAWVGDRVLYEVDVSTLPLIWPREFTDILYHKFVQVHPEESVNRCCENDQHPQHHHHDIMHAHEYDKLDHVHNMDDLPVDEEDS